MTFEDAMAMYENETDRMIDEMYRENPSLQELSLSDQSFDEADLHELQA